eukprot:maker-scaffold_5-snap-gene-3.44-mRNA-1 protein AED:0.27 eAED:0.27 QI:26/1/1/1/1/1/2/52/550
MVLPWIALLVALNLRSASFTVMSRLVDGCLKIAGEIKVQESPIIFQTYRNLLISLFSPYLVTSNRRRSHPPPASLNQESNKKLQNFQDAYVHDIKNKKLVEKQIPDGKLNRAFHFGKLGVKLGLGALNRSREERISNAAKLFSREILRMRGAALKLGQLISMQEEEIIPKEIMAALENSRNNANVMPKGQLLKVLERSFPVSIDDIFVEFNYDAFASASIGQVHSAKLDARKKVWTKFGSTMSMAVDVPVAVKIQFPGVANSIDADFENLRLLASTTGVFPKGAFIENVVKNMKQEIKEEADYILEAEKQVKYKKLLENSDKKVKTPRVYVPDVFVWDQKLLKDIFISEYVEGVPVDKLFDLDSFSQEKRNNLGRKLLELTLLELFHFQFVQSDPNFSNFLYDLKTDTLNLIDFGATRHYPEKFVSLYLQLVKAASKEDKEEIIHISEKLGFFSPGVKQETKSFINAHVQSGLIIGRPFTKDNWRDFDFGSWSLGAELKDHVRVFAKERKVAPPTEVYSLHRKLMGAYMICIKLGAKFETKDLFLETVER